MGTEVNENDAPQMPEGMTPEQRQELLKTVQQYKSADKKTISGSEAVEGAGSTNKGSDVNWDEYDIPFALKERYKEAIYRETPQGPKWVVMQDEFDSSLRDFGAKGAAPRKDGTRVNLGEFLTEVLNDGKGWRAIAIQPVSGQAGVLLQRQVPYILPDPVLLQKDTEVAAPTDPELEAAEDAARAFMESEGLVPSIEETVLGMNPPGRDPRPVGQDFLGGIAADVQGVRQGEDFGHPETIEKFVERSKEDASTLEKFHAEGEN